MSGSPVTKEIKRQAVNIACVGTVFGAVYVTYNAIDIATLMEKIPKGDAAGIVADLTAKKSPEQRYFAYRCVRDQKIPIERDWKGNEIPLSASLQSGVAFDLEKKTMSTEGTGTWFAWFDDLQDGAEVTSRWDVKKGYTQSVRIDAEQVFGEEMKIDTTITPPRRVVYEQITFDRRANKLTTYMVSSEEANTGEQTVSLCAATAAEALKRVRAKWEAPPPTPPSPSPPRAVQQVKGGSFTIEQNKDANNGNSVSIEMVSGRGVRVRSAPDASDEANIIGRLDQGAAVRVVRITENGWKEIEFAGGRGFVIGNLLVPGSPQAAASDRGTPIASIVPTPNPVATVVAVSCPVAVGYVAPDGVEYDGQTKINLRQGNVLTGAVPHLQGTERWVKGQMGRSTVFVRQSDIEGTNCESPTASAQVPVYRQQQPTYQCPDGTTQTPRTFRDVPGGYMCYDGHILWPMIKIN